ncbi:MAG: CDP-glucose 4,6-dehydratase [Acidobacteria bacterium]|nr:MAG: CDP-glucose 4,6-dehydratase [Acidobacteriota bacterium]
MSFWKGKRVLVTGHTGFKGSWLSLWLKTHSAEVCGFSLEPESSPNLFESLGLDGLIDSRIGDVRNLELLEQTFRTFQPEIIFHLAAQSLVRRSYREPVDTYTTNVIGTINLLEAARKTGSAKAIVAITTDKVYENEERAFGYSETDRLGGFDPYSNSKACAELAISSYRNSFFSDGKTLIASARAGNVIGGGDWSEDRLLPDVFRSLIFGDELVIRNPNSIRPWQHTLEPLNGYMLLAEKLFEGKNEFGTAWNFGPDENAAKPVKLVLEEIEKNWDAGVEWKISNGNHPHETNILKLDSSKARAELGWNSILTLPESLTMTIDWYRAFRDKKDLLELTKNQINLYQGRDADKTA